MTAGPTQLLETPQARLRDRLFPCGAQLTDEPHVLWEGEDAKAFLAQAERLSKDLLYCYTYVDEEREADGPALVEVAFRHDQLFHVFHVKFDMKAKKPVPPRA